MEKKPIEELLGPEGLALIEGRARDGMTEREIAESFGVSRRTLFRWKEGYPEVAQALRRGKEAVDYQVEGALLHTALNGNTTAQIFWLRNRRPDKWKDKPEQKSAANEGTGVVYLAPVMEDPGPPSDE